MFRLHRHIRFAINPDGTPVGPGVNGYAGNPPMRGMGSFHDLEVECVAELDPRTQYVKNIKDIDHAFRGQVLPALSRAIAEHAAREPSSLLTVIFRGIDEALPPPHGQRPMLDTIRWHLSPYLSLAMTRSTLAAGTVILRQKFDFCAAHRLHNSQLSAEENVRLFGKCNNASGHGHNYQLEPAVEIDVTAAERRTFTLEHLERLVEDEIIRRFDHKNLNVDTDEFRDGSGVMPSVEQISRVCYELLQHAIERAKLPAKLRGVQVWESDRTSSTYPA